MAGGDKTEKATPKKKAEARKKGQVAKSADLSGAIVMLAGIITLGITGPAAAERMGDVMRGMLAHGADPSVVSRDQIGDLLIQALVATGMAVAPIALTCALAGVAAAVLQVGFKPSTHALKPDPKRLNPVSGFKNIFGPNLFAEALKSVSKVAIVGAIVFAMVWPKLQQYGAMVGVAPMELAGGMSSTVKAVAMRAALAYLLIGLADFAYQRYRMDKNLKMDKQEVTEEAKEGQLPPEVRAQMRRRQMSAARARMMSAIPEADVVVTNPTHFAVALKYDGSSLAPEVVAKGQDLLALRIREIARENGIPVLEDKPLARGLHASCEVGHEIPEEFFAAVAQVLAFVYRMKRVA